MKILLLTASLPYPPQSGGALRTYSIIRGLAEAGHHITLLSFHNGAPPAPHNPLTQLCQHIITVQSPDWSIIKRLKHLLFGGEPDIAVRLQDTQFAEELTRLLNSDAFDVVQVEGIEVAGYLRVVRTSLPDAKLIYDAFNAEAALQRIIAQIDASQPQKWLQSLYSFIQTRRIEGYEKEIVHSADTVICVSDEDANLLRPYARQKEFHVVPSSIFVDNYNVDSGHIKLPQNSLVFTGKMDYRPNVDAMLWFHETMLPRLQDTHLTIVGQQPHPRLTYIAQSERIQITGWVESVIPYMQAADIYIAPLRMGSGTRLKLLEAMACGCAIVATTVAAAGLSPAVKESMVIADEPDQFVKAIRDLLANPTIRSKMGTNARKLVKEHYDWKAVTPQMLTVYESIHNG